MRSMLTVIFILALTAVTYGGEARTLEGRTVAVTTASSVITSKPSRSILIIQNISDTSVWCTVDGTSAAVGQGIGMDQIPGAGRPGGSIFFDVVTPTGSVSCIHGSTGDKLINVIEG